MFLSLLTTQWRDRTTHLYSAAALKYSFYVSVLGVIHNYYIK